MLKSLRKARRWIFRLISNWYGSRSGHRITLEGIIFILITFFIGFAAINTSANLLYLIMSMMLAFLIVSGYLSTRNLRKIQFKRLAVRHISATQTAFIQIEIRNLKKRFASYSLRIRDFVEDGEAIGSCYLFHIAPHSSQTLSYRHCFPRRGLYRFQRLEVVTRFPFGFFERSRQLGQKQEILVYPRMVDVRPLLRGAHVDLGEYETGRKGHGHSLYGLREYNATDSARFIHWKVSARTNKIMIREFEKEEKKKVTLLLGNHIPGPLSEKLDQAFETAVICTASIARYLIKRDFQVQLVTGSGRIPFDTGLSHIYRILRALAMIELEEKNEPAPHMPGMDADSINAIIHFDYRHAPSVPQGAAQIIDVNKVNLPPLEKANRSKRSPRIREEP